MGILSLALMIDMAFTIDKYMATEATTANDFMMRLNHQTRARPLAKIDTMNGNADPLIDVSLQNQNEMIYAYLSIK
jgi:hypothetical protein